MNKYVLKLTTLYYIGTVFIGCNNSTNKNISHEIVRHTVINEDKEKKNNIITHLPNGKKIKEIDFIDICKCKTNAVDTLKLKNKDDKIFYIYRKQFTYDTIINNQYLQFCFSKEFVNKQQIENNLLKIFSDVLVEFQELSTNDNKPGTYFYLYQSKIDISNSFNDSIFYDFQYVINLNSGSSMTKEIRLLVPQGIINGLTNETDISEEKYYKYSKSWRLH